MHDNEAWDLVDLPDYVKLISVSGYIKPKGILNTKVNGSKQVSR